MPIPILDVNLQNEPLMPELRLAFERQPLRNATTSHTKANLALRARHGRRPSSLALPRRGHP